MHTDTVLKVFGLVAGIGLAGGLVVSTTLPRGPVEPGAGVVFLAGPTGEFAVQPAGIFMTGTHLEPGSGPGAAGSLNVRNLTGTTLGLRLRAVPSSADLDDLLSVRIADQDDVVFDGQLADLTTWTELPLTFGSGEDRTLDVTASVRTDAGDRHRARSADVRLELDSVGVQG